MAAPPNFLQSLSSETDATDGDIVTFQIKVSNDPSDPTSISWWRCGEPLRPIPGRRDILSHEDGWHELILSNITDEDEGEYECRAENGRGHNSCFGSLYYYREGGAGTSAEIAMEGAVAEGDGRQSGLLILIDDGSQTEESGSDKSNRKSMTVSEQMQGIIEDLTQSTQGTGSMTLEKDDEGQFDSDIEEFNDEENSIIQNILGMSGQKTASEDTLVPEMPSPVSVVDVAISEGARDPYRPAASAPQKWSSNPNHVKRKKSKDEKEEVVWPPEAVVTFDVHPLDPDTTSVELPFARATTTEDEEAVRSSVRYAGAETPFDVADITEEAVDGSTQSSKDEGAVRYSPTDGSSGAVRSVCLPKETLLSHVDPRISSRTDRDSSLTSVTDVSASAAIASDACQQSSRMSSVKSATYHQTEDGVTSMLTSSVTSHVSSSTRLTRSAGDREAEESFSFTAKKSRMSSTYEADSEPSAVDMPSEQFRNKGPHVYVAIMEFRPMENDEEAVAMKEGQQVEILDASKPRRWLVRTVPASLEERAVEGWVPACYLEKRRSVAYEAPGSYMMTEPDLDPKELEAAQNREAIVKELVETEEDFAKDMQFVVDNYYKHMDNPKLPKTIRDRKGSIFGNFKDISDFHNNVLMEGIHYHAKEPTKLGKTFLRLERDFDMHANYCWSEARAQQLLRDEQLKEYFTDYSRTIDDDKLLSDHLKLPIQRLNDYQLLLKELIKYSSRLHEDTADLQKALDFIHSINKRTKDLQCIQALQGCKGDLLKLGKIIRQDVFDVIEQNKTTASECFLFKGRLFITEKRFESEKEIYHVTNLFRLQDVEMVEKVDNEPASIVFRSHKRIRRGFPLTLRARSLEQKTNWCKDIAFTANQALEELGDLEPSIERDIDLVDTDHPELKHKAEESTEAPEFKKTKVETLKRQESIKKKPLKSSDSVSETPVEEHESALPSIRQESAKKKSKNNDSSVPAISNKPPKLIRQDSVKRKPKSAESSAPQTPIEADITAPGLTRQESIQGKAKSEEVVDKTTSEVTIQKKPRSIEEAAPLLRQESLKKPNKDVKDLEESVSKRDEADSTKKKRGEDLPIPQIVMSEDASGSDARLESAEFGEDNATVASESLRSDDSITPPATGAYAKPPSLPSFPSVYCHLLILIPVLCAFYIVTELLGLALWE